MISKYIKYEVQNVNIVNLYVDWYSNGIPMDLMPCIEYIRIQVFSSGYVDLCLCCTKPGCNMELGRGCSDWCRSNVPASGLRLLRPLANGNSHQQLSKPQSMSNIKAEHSQMVMTNSKKKPVDSKFDEQAAESGRAPHHISSASEGHAVRSWGFKPGYSNWMGTIQNQMWPVHLWSFLRPNLDLHSSPSPNPKNLASYKVAADIPWLLAKYPHFFGLCKLVNILTWGFLKMRRSPT